jgi:hypothetical protein
LHRPDHSTNPAPLVVVRDVLRRNPNATYPDVVAAWRAQHPEGDLTEVRREYDEEVAQRRGRDQGSEHGRTVVWTAVFWVVAHLVLWALFSALAGFRGFGPALLALLIGGAQLVYGIIAG